MSDVMTDDGNLLAAARSGDAEARARLYDRHAPVVLALCHHRSPRDAEDAMQETFIRAFNRLDQVHEPQQLRAWLYGIARHVCAERRRASTRRGFHESTLHSQSATVNGTLVSSPDAIAEQHEQQDHLARAMNELADDERLAVHLYYLETDPQTAAHEALGLSRSGYYKLLARAREKLARRLGVGVSTGSTDQTITPRP